MPRKIASPSADVSSTARWEAALPSSNNTCAPATAADWGSTTLILISAAEAAASRQITLVRIRENRMHSSFVSRKGLVSTVRASLLALRVRTAFAVRRMRPAFPGFPSDRLRISSLTVARQRGILTRFPPHLVNEDARTKEVEKERKATSRFLKQSFRRRTRKWHCKSTTTIPLLHRHADRNCKYFAPSAPGRPRAEP